MDGETHPTGDREHAGSVVEQHPQGAISGSTRDDVHVPVAVAIAWREIGHTVEPVHRDDSGAEHAEPVVAVPHDLPSVGGGDDQVEVGVTVKVGGTRCAGPCEIGVEYAETT